jgi:hypothetical protein
MYDVDIFRQDHWRGHFVQLDGIEQRWLGSFQWEQFHSVGFIAYSKNTVLR